MIIPSPSFGGVNPTLISVLLNTIRLLIIGALICVVIEADELDANDVPPELVAETVNVYDVFAVNPITFIGDDVPVDISPKLLVTI